MGKNNILEDYAPKPRRWTRAFFLIVVLLGYSFSKNLLWFLTIFQFLWSLIKKEENNYVQEFGKAMVVWNSQAIRFCLCSEEEPPFPFSRWPSLSD